MSGTDVLACVTDIIAAFEGSADATRRIQLHDKRKKKTVVKDLETQLQLSLRNGRDELIRSREMFIGDCGYYIVPGGEPYSCLVEQLTDAKTNVEAIRLALNMFCDNESQLKDPSKIKDDADRWRWVAIEALTRLRTRIMASGGPQPLPSSPPSAYPPSSYAPTSPPAEDLSRAPPLSDPSFFFPYDTSHGGSAHRPQPLPISRARADPGPSAHTASSPPEPHRMQPPRETSRDFGIGDVPWTMGPRPHESRRPPAQHALSSEGTSSRAPIRAGEEVANSLPDQMRGLSLATAARNQRAMSLVAESPNPPPLSHSPTTDSHRDSVVTFRTTSSGNSNELAPIQSESRRPSSLFGRFTSARRKSSRQQGTIEHTVGEILSNASSKNDWHGFCRGTFEILEDLSNGLELVQRPLQLHSTKMYLQCKRCAFPGYHMGKDSKTKIPNTTIMTSASGIRYRWMFLAKSHVKSEDNKGGVINVAEQTKESAYRCTFCYIEGILPDKLGGVETLMNHIWQHHRRHGMSDHMLKRAGCIIGREAKSYEPFDINIPSFKQDGRGEDFVETPGEAAQMISVGVKSDGQSDTIPGICVGVRELSEMGRRGSPVELQGSLSYLAR